MTLTNIVIHLIFSTLLYNLNGRVDARISDDVPFDDDTLALLNSSNSFFAKPFDARILDAVPFIDTLDLSNNSTDETIPNDPISSFDHKAEDSSINSYEQRRAAVIEQEELKATGGHLILSDQELKAHEIFMQQKTPEMLSGFINSAQHAPAMHFFHAKTLIEQSEVFKFLRQMPKGAILHLHNTASVSSEWVVRNLTRMPGMLSCYTADGVLVLSFRIDQNKHQCLTPYKLVAEERARAESEHEFDKRLEQHINLYTNQPETEYSTIEKVWSEFSKMFVTLGNALSYLPAFRAFHRRMLEEMYEDKVMYAEVRMRFRPLFGDNGVTTTEEQSIEELVNIVREFRMTHPDFLGIKVIFATNGRRNKTDIRAEFEVFKRWHALYPDFVIGFDLVGKEDSTKGTLHSVVGVLQDIPKTAKFFFHAGETDWWGSSTDLNLLDAILMNTARIGHGYALLKHPVMRKAVQDRQIALEVCPLSNQILHLVWDLRNHPGGFFMSEDVPMVIANDDPGFWGAKGLSYDMYYAIMSFAPCNAGLKTLKNIVWNSIRYTALSEQEKSVAKTMLTQQWNAFVERVVQGEEVEA